MQGSAPPYALPHGRTRADLIAPSIRVTSAAV
jgi:hypothetical protein